MPGPPSDDPITGVIRTINWFLGYLRNNIFTIVGLVLATYYLRDVIAPWWKQLVERLTSSSTASDNANSNNDAAAVLPARLKTDQEKTEDLRRIRLLQQERAAKASVEAEKKRKEKEEQERMRKNMVAKKKHDQGGDRLGSNSSSSGRGGGYNPMQPWTGSGSGGYKAQRRSVSRG